MTFSTIELTRQGSIALLGLNRPDKLNAINAIMISEINAVLDQTEAEDSVLAIVLHGRGRAFSAGFVLQAEALIDIIVSLSRLAWVLQDTIAEIDINPIIVNSRDAFAVDALIALKQQLS